ncbi:MAG: S8 family peptidase [Muribaculaceae bacterium]|nr:S8 family peptidase [Muribaculaceae bacterium]
MKKLTLTVSALAAAAMLAGAQNKLDPRTILFSSLQKAAAEVTAPSDSAVLKVRRYAPAYPSAGFIDVFVTLNGAPVVDDIEALGLLDPVVCGSVAVGSIPFSDLGRLGDSPLVKGVSVSGKPHLLNDLSRADTGVEIIRVGGDGLPKDYDGQGVIVSLYDQGIEPGHINFLKKDRSESRVRRIWHYDTSYTTEGQQVTTETVFDTPEAVASFRTDDNTLTHGTHTLGCMAGSFGEEADKDYSGMAPGADIAIGCGTLMYSNVARAISRFCTYAEEEGKPLVINLSFGDNIGPHDGTDAFPQFLNSVGAAVPIFMASGNEGERKIALHKTFSDEDVDLRTVITPSASIRSYLGVSWEAATEVQVWSEDNTPFTLETGLWDKAENQWVVSLPVPPDGEAAYLANGMYAGLSQYRCEEFDYLYKDSAIGVATGYDPNNGRYMADIWYMLDKQLNHIDRNIVPVLIVRGLNGKRVDIYCDGDYNELGAGKMKGWDEGIADGSISNIACGENTIAVGSYCTRLITDPAIEGEVSYFTSWGVLPDGRVLPDILAPGECIASSMSTPFTESDYFDINVYPAVYGVMYGEDNPFYWTIQMGTSQASPTMAGIAALWLQANPDLTPAEIKEIAKSTARHTSDMTPQCGAGKVDALAGIRKALSLSGADRITDNGRSGFMCTPLDGGYNIEYTMPERFDLNLYDMTGRKVWSAVSPDGSAIHLTSEIAGRGIFLVRMSTGKDMKTVKVKF